MGLWGLRVESWTGTTCPGPWAQGNGKRAFLLQSKTGFLRPSLCTPVRQGKRGCPGALATEMRLDPLPGEAWGGPGALLLGCWFFSLKSGLL